VASPGNRHCANCISAFIIIFGTLSFPTATHRHLYVLGSLSSFLPHGLLAVNIKKDHKKATSKLHCRVGHTATASWTKTRGTKLIRKLHVGLENISKNRRCSVAVFWWSGCAVRLLCVCLYDDFGMMPTFDLCSATTL